MGLGKTIMQFLLLFKPCLIVVLCVILGVAQDSLINHPVMCYKKTRLCDDCPYDSTLVGKITYDPMPRYLPVDYLDQLL